MFDDCYEFGGYHLNPRDRLLLFGDRRIALVGLDFDLLVFMVERPGILLKKEYLLNEVWGPTTIVEEGNLSGHIAKIRKALDCDPHNPRFIETVARKGYRFIGKVVKIPYEQVNVSFYDNAEPVAPKEDPLGSRDRIMIESHKFVPVYLGRNSFDSLEGPEIENEWGSYKSIETDVGRVCIFPFGIGVWHLVDTVEFESLTALAQWRRKTYEDIKLGKHAVTGKTQDLLSSINADDNDYLHKRVGDISYVLSLLVLVEQCWQTSDEKVNVLKLLSCPTPLSFHANQTRSKMETMRLEKQIITEGFGNPDIKEFGMPGIDLGFASWPGVSYHCSSPDETGLLGNIVEFEVAVQATWWLSSIFNQECLANSPNETNQVEAPVRDLVKQFGRLKAIDAVESIAKRTMREAILETSRIEDLVQSTLDYYQKL